MYLELKNKNDDLYKDNKHLVKLCKSYDKNKTNSINNNNDFNDNVNNSNDDIIKLNNIKNYLFDENKLLKKHILTLTNQNQNLISEINLIINCSNFNTIDINRNGINHLNEVVNINQEKLENSLNLLESTINNKNNIETFNYNNNNNNFFINNNNNNFKYN